MSPQVMTRPTKVEWNCETIEDVLVGAMPPVSASVRGAFAAVQRPVDPTVDCDPDLEGVNSVVELLTASGNNELLHVRRDQESESGWSSREVIVGTRSGGRRRRSDGYEFSGSIVEIQAFYQRMGPPEDFRGHRIFALVHFAETEGDSRTVVPMSYDPSKDLWAELNIKNGGRLANALARTRQTAVYRRPNGKHYFYGVSTSAGVSIPQFFIVYEVDSEFDPWDAVLSGEIVEADQDSTYRLLPPRPDDDSEMMLLSIKGGSAEMRGLDFDEDYIDFGEPEEAFDLGHGDLSAANILPLPTRTGNRGFMLHTPAMAGTPNPRQLFYITGHEEGRARSVKMTGDGTGPALVDQIVLGRDALSRAVLFAVDGQDRHLWIRRQGGQSADGKYLEFGPWVPLGETAATIGCPRAMLDGAELFMVSPDRRLIHLAQDPKTTLWHNSLIEEPVADRSSVTKPGTVHAVTFTVGDKVGPIAGAAVQLTAGTPCTAMVGDIGYHLDNRRPVNLVADSLGQVTVKLPANDISAPRLSLVSVDGDASCEADPGGRVADRLAGKETDVTTITSTSLDSAGLMPKAATQPQREFVTRIVRDLGSSAASAEKSSAAGVKRGAKVHEYSLKMGEGAAPELSYDGQAMARTDGLKPSKGDGFLDFVPDDMDLGVFQFLGDFLNWLKRGLRTFREWVVTIAEGVVNFVIRIGETVKEFVISTVTAIGSAFQSLMEQIADAFNELGEAIVEVTRKVVKFVARRIGWGDVVMTTEFLEELANRGLRAAENFFDQEAVDWINGVTANLKGRVESAFQDAERLFAGTDPFNPGAAATAPDSRTSGIAKFTAKNSVAMGTVTRQLDGGKSTIEKALSAPPPGPGIEAIRREITESLLPNLKNNVGAVADDFIALFDNGVLGVLQNGLIGTLRIAKDLVIGAIDLAADVLKIILKAVAAMFALLRALLNAPIYIPIISEFWAWSVPDGYQSECDVSGLTVLRLMSAAIAVPVTLVHKMFHGSMPDLRQVHTKMDEGGLSWSGLFRGITKTDSVNPLLPELKSAGAAVTPRKVSREWKRVIVGLVAYMIPDNPTAEKIQRTGAGDTDAELEANIAWVAKEWPPRANIIGVVMGIAGIALGLIGTVCTALDMPLALVKRMTDSSTSGATPLSGSQETLRKVISTIKRLTLIPRFFMYVSRIILLTIGTLPKPDQATGGPIPNWVMLALRFIPLVLGLLGLFITVGGLIFDALTIVVPFAHYFSEILEAGMSIVLVLLGGITPIVNLVNELATGDAVLGELIPELVAGFLEGLSEILGKISNVFSWLSGVGTVTTAAGVGAFLIASIVTLTLVCGGAAYVVSLAAIGTTTVGLGFTIGETVGTWKDGAT